MDWIEGGEEQKPILVVAGPAGSGKTSLLKTIARTCKEKDYRTASFFFSATDRKRNNPTALINTIVYQIAVAVPELQPYIARAIKDDSTVLSWSSTTQSTRLLIQPQTDLLAVYPDLPLRRQLIIIDALDECTDQLEVLSSLTRALSDTFLDFRCLLSSRLDSHIENALALTKPLIHGRLYLGDEESDIRSFLAAEFERVLSQHPFGTHIPPDWPKKADVETLVERCRGQFLYASTVIRYIDSPFHQPTDRLHCILHTPTMKYTPSPFVDLDDLYRILMSSLKNIEAATEILGVELMRSISHFWTPRSLDEYVFKRHFETLDADIVLAPLRPILVCENGSMKFLHSSFAEFLLDSTRSREFFVRPNIWQKWIVSRLVPYFYDKNSRPKLLLSTCYLIPS